MGESIAENSKPEIRNPKEKDKLQHEKAKAPGLVEE
jgi:hypothetical protein